MKKYMILIQHEDQKSAYIEFMAKGDKSAQTQAEEIFKNYKTESFFMPKRPYIDGNFTGQKPRIKSHYVSKWVYSDTAVSAWGYPTGGFWKEL